MNFPPDRSVRRGPYPGPRPFGQGDEEVFFGRKRETFELFDLVLAYPAVLLYAESGAGKTSLVDAGVRPLVADAGAVLVRLRLSITPGSRPAGEAVENVYVASAIAGLRAVQEHVRGLAPANSLSGTIWPETDLVLCFDQFEEVFAHPEHWRARDAFFEDVAKLLRNPECENIHALFVVREDYLAPTLSYGEALPKGLRIRYHLERLRGDEALRAIADPAKKYGKPFEPNVAERLVSDLSRIQVESGFSLSRFGRLQSVEGEYVEPVHLQVVCERLWSNLSPDAERIGSRHVETYGDVDRALTEHYERALAAAIATGGADEESLRNWFENRLLTSGGTRGLVYRGETRTEGMPNAIVDVLENEHVIRAEIRSQGRWYELTHDRFIKPVMDSNKAWRQRQTTRERATVSVGGPAVAFWLCAMLAGLVYLAVALLPVIGTDGRAVWSAPALVAGYTIPLSPEGRLLWLVVLAAAFGSFMRTVLAFTQSFAAGTLSRPGLIALLLQVPVGITFCLLAYLQLRAFFMPDRVTDANLNVYGVLAIFGTIGFFSPQATTLVRGLGDTLLSTREGASNRGTSSRGLVRPRILNVVPTSLRAGTGSTLLRVQGVNFDQSAIATVNGAPRRSVFVTSTEMIVYLDAADCAAATVLRLVIRYAPPSGAVSPEVLISVHERSG